MVQATSGELTTAQKAGKASSYIQTLDNAQSNSSKTSTVNTQGASVYFFLLTTLYSLFAYILTNSSNPEADTKSQTVYFFVYLLLAVIGSYSFNIQMAKTHCGTSQPTTAANMTILPWICIFGVLCMMLKMFPGWLSPFANTFGYGFAKLGGLDSFMINKVLQPNDAISNHDLKVSLADMITDPSIIFNQIPQETKEFESFWNNMKPLLRPDAFGSSAIQAKLRRFVTMKFAVSWYLWLIMTGMLTISFSLNTLISGNCSQDASMMMDKHDQYEACLQGDISGNACSAETATQALDPIIRNGAYIKNTI